MLATKRVVLLWAMLLSLHFKKCDNTTSRSDCSDANMSVPLGTGRLCKVHDKGALTWKINHENCNYHPTDECHISSGMGLMIECDQDISNDEGIIIYKNDSVVSNSKTLSIPKANMGH